MYLCLFRKILLHLSVLAAIAVNEEGYLEVLGAAEGMREDKVSWVNFFWLKERGLDSMPFEVLTALHKYS